MQSTVHGGFSQSTHGGLQFSVQGGLQFSVHGGSLQSLVQLSSELGGVDSELESVTGGVCVVVVSAATGTLESVLATESAAHALVVKVSAATMTMHIAKIRFTIFSPNTATIDVVRVGPSNLSAA
jgi:hypothetical protein